MTRTVRRLLVIGLLISPAACDKQMSDAQLPQTVSRLELDRYTGRWYEVAKIPNRFQDHCDHNAMAEYEMLQGGELRVTNSCVTRDGELDTVVGVARVTDPVSKAKLEVSFVRLLGWHLFWGDYWVLALDPDYEYAVIGTPSRRYGWVLARGPELSNADWLTIDRLLEQQGYTASDFVRSPQRARSELAQSRCSIAASMRKTIFLTSG